MRDMRCAVCGLKAGMLFENRDGQWLCSACKEPGGLERGPFVPLPKVKICRKRAFA